MLDRTPTEAPPIQVPSVSRHFWPILGCAVTVWGVLTWRFARLVEDSFISFRFARNLADGLGLAFNPDPAVVPVEGYTNFLYVLLLAAWYRCGGDMFVGAYGVSLLCGLGLLVHVAVWLRRRDLGTLALGSGVLLAASFPSFVIWSTGGLAPVPLAWALFAVFDRLTTNARPGLGWAGLAAAAAILIRADGFAFLGAVLSGVLLWSWMSGRRDATRAALWVGVVAAVAFLAHVGFRLAYHGDWLPQTARIKAGLTPFRLERGLFYVVSLGLTALSYPIGLAAILLTRQPLARSLGVVVLLMSAYVVLAGGDYMVMGRFLVPIVPFLAVGVGLAVEAMRRRSASAAGALCLGLIALSLAPLFDFHLVPESFRQRFGVRYGAKFRSEIAEWDWAARDVELRSIRDAAIGEVVQPGESMVVKGIGTLGWYTDLFLYDTLGLVTREVADVEPMENVAAGHDRELGFEHFMDRRPTYLPPLLVQPPKLVEVTESRLRAVSPWPVEFERHPVVHESIAPGSHLVLTRLVWNDD